MKYLLDTSICVFYLRKRLNLKNFLGDNGLKDCCISEITVYELRYGSENSSNPRKSHKELDSFLEAITTIPVGGLHMRYAKEKLRLRKIGKPLHDEFDLLIGITASENNLTLVTDNIKDFQNIEGIKIINWMSQ